MENLKILVLEDDALQANDLCKMLEKAGYTHVCKAHNAERALELFREQSPDLLLLDIHLRNSDLNGIQLGEIMLQAKSVPLIYLTAYPNDFFEWAKPTRPAAFFEKPYNPTDVLRAIDLAISNFADKIEPEQRPEEAPIEFSNLLLTKESKQIWVKTKAGDPYKKIAVDDILFIRSENNYLNFFVAGRGTPLVVTARISDFAAKVKCPLVQVHRCYIANVKHIESFDMSKSLIAVKGASEPIKISDTFAAHFIQAMHNCQ